MTKKDYRLIASAIATMPNQAHRNIAARALASALARDNASFQKDLFLAACKAIISTTDKEAYRIILDNYNDATQVMHVWQEAAKERARADSSAIAA